MKQKPLLPRPLDVAAIPSAGLTEKIEASAGERAAIADAYDLPNVNSLSADLVVARDAAGAVTVEGRVRAEIVQTYVLSLVPVEQSIDEAIEARFVAEGSALAAAANARSEAVLDPLADVPEVLIGPALDLGELALEHFLLAIDPYPRAPGAALPADLDLGHDSAAESPFAALEALKRKPS